MRSRNMRSRGTGCTSVARKPGGTNLRRGRGIPARHIEANNRKEEGESIIRAVRGGFLRIVAAAVVEFRGAGVAVAGGLLHLLQ